MPPKVTTWLWRPKWRRTPCVQQARLRLQHSSVTVSDMASQKLEWADICGSHFLSAACNLKRFAMYARHPQIACLVTRSHHAHQSHLRSGKRWTETLQKHTERLPGYCHQDTRGNGRKVWRHVTSALSWAHSHGTCSGIHGYTHRGRPRVHYYLSGSRILDTMWYIRVFSGCH